MISCQRKALIMTINLCPTAFHIFVNTQICTIQIDFGALEDIDENKKALAVNLRTSLDVIFKCVYSKASQPYVYDLYTVLNNVFQTYQL